jgi:hypothetical protein
MSRPFSSHTIAAEFAALLEYARSLRFKDTPNYALLRHMFRSLFERESFTDDLHFDWIKPTYQVKNPVPFLNYPRGHPERPHNIVLFDSPSFGTMDQDVQLDPTTSRHPDALTMIASTTPSPAERPPPAAAHAPGRTDTPIPPQTTAPAPDPDPTPTPVPADAPAHTTSHVPAPDAAAQTTSHVPAPAPAPDAAAHKEPAPAPDAAAHKEPAPVPDAAAHKEPAPVPDAAAAVPPSSVLQRARPRMVGHDSGMIQRAVRSVSRMFRRGKDRRVTPAGEGDALIASAASAAAAPPAASSTCLLFQSDGVQK